MHGDGHGHDHRLLEEDEFETVQATLEWKPGKPAITAATGTLQ